MKKIKTICALFLLSLLLVNCKSDKKSIDFKELTDHYFDDKNSLNPIDATINGQNQYHDQLVFEMTDSYRKKQALFFDKYQSELSKVNKEQLSPEELNSYEIIKWEIEVGKEVLHQPTNLMPIHQFWGTHLTMSQFASGSAAQPFKTEKDYRNFLKRMDLYAVWIDSAMVYMKKGIAKGLVLPKSLTIKVIPQFEEIITPEVEDNLFYSTLKTFPASFTEAQKSSLTKEYTSAIQEKLMPQYKKMIAFLKGEYLAASRSTSGIGSIPNGKEMYTSYVKQWTTTNKTPNEIHEIGLKEVARWKK